MSKHDGLPSPEAPAARPPAGMGPRPAVAVRGPRLSTPRRAVLSYLLDQGSPCTVATISSALGQHENTVREHLDGLVAGDLVTRSRSTAARRGRPAWLYQTNPRTTAPHAVESASLAIRLASYIAATASDPAAAGHAAGIPWGESEAERLLDLTEDPPDLTMATALEELAALHTTLGFEASVTEDGSAVRMARCPLLPLARQEPTVVCAVHRGATQGALNRITSTPHDPDLASFSEPGACVLRLVQRRA